MESTSSSTKKHVLILGGCSSRGQKAAARCIDEGHFVLIVDNTKDESKHPQNWAPEFNRWNNQDLVFYHEDIIKFMMEDNLFTYHIWDMVMQFAKIKDEKIVREIAVNNMLDSTFFYWLTNILYKPIVITNMETRVSRELTPHFHNHSLD